MPGMGLGVILVAPLLVFTNLAHGQQLNGANVCIRKVTRSEKEEYKSRCFLNISWCKKTRYVTKTTDMPICCDGWLAAKTGDRDCNIAICHNRLSAAGTCANGGRCVSPDKCECKEGWKGPNCEDKNECTENNGGCSHTCVSGPEKFTCSCPERYGLANPTTCEPICFGKPPGECENAGICKAPGECSCADGFKGIQCEEDIDECQLDANECSDLCNNEVGSYKCSCNKGYELLEDGKTCSDIDECEGNANDCGQLCINKVGSYKCKCKEGYELMEDGKTCSEIVDCPGDHDCSQLCTVENGANKCSCEEGYQLMEDGKICSDFDECDGNANDCGQVCINEDGSYKCSCKEGYELTTDGKTCSDINECEGNANECSHGCINEDGSYKCSCNEGYELKEDLKTCSDFDECEGNANDCDQMCINEVASYKCSCKEGYELMEDGKTCSDINECEGNANECSHGCINAEGSYRCSCEKGYELMENGKTCSDTNECKRSNGGCSNTCVNEEGSYHCECPVGYALDDEKGRTCEDVNECNAENDCAKYCVNTRGSYHCKCPPGYNLIDGTACQDIDECTQSICQHHCENKPGSYECSCEEPFTLMTDGHNCQDLSKKESIKLCSHGDDPASGCAPLCVGLFPCLCPEGTKKHENGRNCIKYTDPCLAAPCKHGGKCITTFDGEYRCDCFAALYQGDHCQNGIIVMPPDVQVRAGEITPANIPVRAKPEKNLLLKLVEKDKTVKVFPDPIIVEHPTAFSVQILKRGTHNLTFDITGESADVYDDSVSMSIKAHDVFSRLKLYKSSLPKGCFWYLLTFNRHKLWFSSTSPWYKLNKAEVVYTSGIVMLSHDNLTLPVSTEGAEIKTGSRIFLSNAPSDEVDATQRANDKNISCKDLSPSKRDMDEFREARSILWTLFNALNAILPYWLRLFPSEAQTGSIPFKPQILSGKEVQTQAICTGAPTNDDTQYLVFRFPDPFYLRVLEETFPISEGGCCIVVDMLRSVKPTFTFMFSEEAAAEFMHMDMFESVTEQTYVTMYFTGFSISLAGDIQLGEKAERIGVWNGAQYFTFPFSKKATVWSTLLVKQDYVTEDKMFDFKLEATLETYMADIDPHTLFTHIFVKPRDVLMRALKAKVDIGLQLLGKRVEISMTPTFNERRAIVAMGGYNRVYCGEKANPPGIFGRVSIGTKLFQGNPIIGDLILGSDQELKFFKTFPRDGDKVPITEQWVNDTTDILRAFPEVESMKASLAKIDIPKIESANIRNKLEILQNSLNKFSHLVKEINVKESSPMEFSDFTKAEAECVSEIHSTYLALDDYLSIQLDSSHEELLSVFRKQVPILRHHSSRIVFQLYKGTIPFFPNTGTFGFQGLLEMTILGMRFGIEGDAVFTDEKLFYCRSDFSDFYNHLRGERAMRVLGLVTWGKHSQSTKSLTPLFWKYFIPEVGVGLEIAFSQESPKFVTRLKTRWRLLGFEASGDLFVTSKGVFASVQANLWGIFRSKLTVGVEYSMNPKDWKVWFTGDFLPGDDHSFQGSLWEAVRKSLSKFERSASQRLKKSEKALQWAQDKLSNLQGPLDAKKRKYLSAQAKFDDAIASLERKKTALEAAKAKYKASKDKLSQLEAKLKKICEIKSCAKRCIPGWKRLKWDKCAIKIPEPRCVLSNIWCRIRRFFIFGAMKAAKLSLHIPILALDLAKAAVSGMQILVDKSRFVLNVAAAAFDATKLIAKGVEKTAGIAQSALAAVRAKLGPALQMLKAFTENTLQKYLDIKTCGFNTTLSAVGGSEFSVHCNVNFMNRGWKKHFHVIDFKNIFGSLWKMAKNFIKKIGIKMGKRKRREIEHGALSKFHKIYRRQAIDEEQGESSESWTFESKRFWDDQCKIYKPNMNFIKDSLASLINISTTIHNDLSQSDQGGLDQIDWASEIQSVKDEEKPGAQDVYKEFNLTKEQVDKALENMNLEDDDVFRQMNNTLLELNNTNEEGIQVLKETDVISMWIDEMESGNTLDISSECGSFADCLVYAFGELHSLLDSVNPRLVQEATSRLPDIEEQTYSLLENNTSSIEEILVKARGIALAIQNLDTDDVFCGTVPVITSGPNDTMVSIGETVTLSCTAEGKPDPKIHWLREDNPLTPTNGNSITLVNVTSQEAGLYKCIAENHMGNSSTSEAKLDVVFPPEVATKLPKSIDMINGESNTLECNISARPAVAITWFSSHSNKPISTERILQLEHQVNSTSLLKCIGNNSYGSTESNEVLVRVKSASPASPMVHLQVRYLARQVHNGTTSLLGEKTTGATLADMFKSAIKSIAENTTSSVQATINSIDQQKSSLNITVAYQPGNTNGCVREVCKQRYSDMSVEVFNALNKLIKVIEEEHVLFISDGIGIVLNPASIGLSDERSLCHHGFPTEESTICASSPELQLDPPSNLEYRTEGGVSVFEWKEPVYRAFVTKYQIDLHNKEDGSVTSFTTENSEPSLRIEDSIRPGQYEARVSAYTQSYSSPESNTTIQVKYLGSTGAQINPSTTGTVVGVSVTVGVIAIALVIIGAVMYSSKSHKTGSTPSLTSTMTTSTGSLAVSQSGGSETSSKVMAAWQPVVSGDQIPRSRPGTSESSHC